MHVWYIALSSFYFVFFMLHFTVFYFYLTYGCSDTSLSVCRSNQVHLIYNKAYPNIRKGNK